MISTWTQYNRSWYTVLFIGSTKWYKEYEAQYDNLNISVTCKASKDTAGGCIFGTYKEGRLVQAILGTRRVGTGQWLTHLGRHYRPATIKMNLLMQWHSYWLIWGRGEPHTVANKKDEFLDNQLFLGSWEQAMTSTRYSTCTWYIQQLMLPEVLAQNLTINATVHCE